MLQIIGFILCTMLVVKGFEINANPAFRREDGQTNAYALTATILAFVGAFILGCMLIYQGFKIQDFTSSQSGVAMPN